MDYQWWEGQPVLEVNVKGGISNRDEAFNLAKSMVDQIEQSGYPHVIVILDLSDLGRSPSAAALIGGNLPETLKIEHLVMVNAPGIFRIVTMPFRHLRNKLHFVSSQADAAEKARSLLPKVRA